MSKFILLALVVQRIWLIARLWLNLMKDGYSVVGEAEDADTVVVNTCGFIEDSKKESIQKILEVAELKAKEQ